MDYHHGKFIWFEHVSHDIGGARAFYESLFGWHTDMVEIPASVPYPMIYHAGHEIGGFREGPAGTPTRWISYLSVPDIDASFRDGIAAGGDPVMPPVEYGTRGCGAVLNDPTGAEFVIWQGTRGDPPDVAEIPEGSWYWNELVTTDEKRAMAYYENAFGFTGAAVDREPMGAYYLLRKDDIPRAGLMRAADPEERSHWRPYVRVADCDACAAQARTLGARVAQPPRDIAAVGRFSVLTDPWSATVAVMQPKPATR